MAFFGPLHGLGVEKCELLPNGTLRGRISLPDGRMPADSCGAGGIPEGTTLFAFSPKRASRVGITEKGKQWATQTNGVIESARNKPLQPHKQLQRKPLHRFASVSRKTTIGLQWFVARSIAQTIALQRARPQTIAMQLSNPQTIAMQSFERQTIAMQPSDPQTIAMQPFERQTIAM